MDVVKELDSIKLSCASNTCESGMDIIHPAFVNVLSITIVIIA